MQKDMFVPTLMLLNAAGVPVPIPEPQLLLSKCQVVSFPWFQMDQSSSRCRSVICCSWFCRWPSHAQVDQLCSEYVPHPALCPKEVLLAPPLLPLLVTAATGDALVLAIALELVPADVLPTTLPFPSCPAGTAYGPTPGLGKSGLPSLFQVNFCARIVRALHPSR